MLIHMKLVYSAHVCICHDQQWLTLQHTNRVTVYNNKTVTLKLKINAAYGKPTGDTHTKASAVHCPQCPQHGPRSPFPSPSACLLLHYLKHSLVFICRAGDVASSSTVPSRAVYIREPIWLYKTRQRKGGGSEPESGETWKPFYRAANCALHRLVL